MWWGGAGAKCVCMCELPRPGYPPPSRNPGEALRTPTASRMPARDAFRWRAALLLSLALPTAEALVRPSGRSGRTVRPSLAVRTRPAVLASEVDASVATGSAPAVSEPEPWLPAYTVPEPGARYPYTLTDLPRPAWRGKMMGWLHRTRVWYLLAVSYVVLAVRVSPVPMSPLNVALRVMAAIATSANIFISDGYHNGDTRGERRNGWGGRGRSEAYDPVVERRWLKWDYIGISAILTTQYWLWASNFGWVKSLEAGAWLSGVARMPRLRLSHSRT